MIAVFGIVDCGRAISKYSHFLFQKGCFIVEKQVFYVHTIREKLRQAAIDTTDKLHRSISRLTSYDNLPCDEYYHEVQNQKDLVNKLLYLQNCRAAVERCISSGAAVVRLNIYGNITVTRFYLTNSHKIKAVNLNF